jgi:hypothetical protein
MRDPRPHMSAPVAVLLLAEIKHAVEAFDEGDSNVFETLRVIVSLLEQEHLLLQQLPTRRAA